MKVIVREDLRENSEVPPLKDLGTGVEFYLEENVADKEHEFVRWRENGEDEYNIVILYGNKGEERECGACSIDFDWRSNEEE